MKQIWQNKHNVCNLWTFKSNPFSCLVILNEGKLLNSNNANLLIEDRQRADIFILNEQSRPWNALISISFWMIDRLRYKLNENHQVCDDSCDHLEKRSFLLSWSLRKFLILYHFNSLFEVNLDLAGKCPSERKRYVHVIFEEKSAPTGNYVQGLATKIIINDYLRDYQYLPVYQILFRCGYWLHGL